MLEKVIFYQKPFKSFENLINLSNCCFQLKNLKSKTHEILDNALVMGIMQMKGKHGKITAEVF